MAMLPGTLVDRVAKIITRYSMLPRGGRVGVAVSGGADSVVLLHILKQLAPQFATFLTVLHVNHQLRGEESELDQEFVSKLADELGLPFLAERMLVSSSGNLEENARDLRREFFRRARQQLSLSAVALGHSRSDQAETVLYRFLRGSGTAGLSGMRLVSADGLVRPLLTTSRQEIRAFSSEQGLSWREDSTNLHVGFVRNRLRHETIPHLSATYNPNLEAVLARMAETAQDEDDFWNSKARKALNALSRPIRWGLSFQVPDLASLDRALLRRTLRLAISQVRQDNRPPDLQHVEAVCALCASTEGHDRAMIPGVDAMRSFATLLLAHPGRLSEARQYRIPLHSGEQYELPFGAGTVSLEGVNRGTCFYANVKDNPEKAVESFILTREALTVDGALRPLAVRNWQPGDQLARPGHQFPDKLKALFQQHKVLLWERRHWPVLVAGEEVVWTRRFGCAATFEQDTGSPEFRFTYSTSEQLR